MKLEQLKAFLATLGVFNLKHSGGKWAQASCPLSCFTHTHGMDTNPSFGVTVGDEKSHFNCYVCSKGSLAELVGQIELYCKAQPQYAKMYQLAKAREILQHEEDGLTVLPEYQELVPSPYTEFQEWPEYWLEDYPHVEINKEAELYVISHRHLYAPSCIHFDLRWDAKKRMVVCPFRTVSGKLAGARGRAIDADVEKQWRHFDYAWNGVRNSNLIWYNETALELPGPLVVVEGQFDAMRVWRYHEKVVAILSAKTTLYKMRKLTAVDTIGLMLDNDKTGATKAIEWQTYLSYRGVEVHLINLPEGVKDAGEAPEDWLQETFSQG